MWVQKIEATADNIFGPVSYHNCANIKTTDLLNSRRESTIRKSLISLLWQQYNFSNQSMFRLGLKLKHNNNYYLVKHRRFPLQHQETLVYSQGDWALAQLVQRACGVSIRGVIQKLSPAQTALGGPDWAGVLGQMTPDVSANLIHFGILWDSVADVRSTKDSSRFAALFS